MININQGLNGLPPGGMPTGSVVPRVRTQTFTTSGNAIIRENVVTSISVNMSALGKSITLPAATGIYPGRQVALFKNAGSYPFGVRDGTGALLFGVAAGGVAYLSLEDGSTTAGSWSVTGTGIEPGLITIDSTFSSTYGATVLAPFVALDSNTSIHFANLSSGFAAFLVDNTGEVLTTPVSVDATASSVPWEIFKISATSAMLFYGATNLTNCVVLSVSGTSPSLTLTVNSSAALTSAQTGIASGPPSVCALSSTLYLYCSTTAGHVFSQAFSVSSVTITAGTALDTVVANALANSTTVYTLTSTTGAVIYKSGAAAPYANNVAVVSVSGTTCTFGTPAAITNCASSQTTQASSCQLSATKILIADDNNTTVVRAQVATISAGTTVTAGTFLAVETGLATNLVEYVTSGATRYNPHLYPLSSSTALLWYLDGSGVSRCVILTESAGTITKGNILYASISNAASGSTGYGFIGYQNTSDFMAIVQYGATSAWKSLLVPHKIASTTITYGDSGQLPELSPASLASAVPNTRLSSGDYLFIGANATAIPVFRSNGDALNKRGAIPIPNMGGLTVNPVCAVSSNRAVIVASTAGTTVGASTQQLRVLNVEIAA